jgi:DNA polymerase-4
MSLLPTSNSLGPTTICRDCCEVTEGEPQACEHCGSTRLRQHAELAGLEIAHIDCDAFYASVEKRDRPGIRHQPVIVGHPGGRGVVTTACYIARRFGVRSAMPMFKALAACPDAVVIPPDMAKYKAVSAQIRDIFLAATPVIEPVSLDEAYLDLSEQHRHEGPTAASALARIAQRVEREVCITVSMGLAPNKFLAKLASELEKPGGFSVIGRAEAKAFLAPLSVSKIHGVGPATADRMRNEGLHTIADLQALSPRQIEARFGSFGRRLSMYVQGQDERNVVPFRRAKSVSAETTFRQDIRDPDALVEIAAKLCERVAQHLQRKEVAGNTLVLKLKTADFHLMTRNRRLPFPTQRADLLLEQAEGLIRLEADGRFFRLIGIGAADLAPAEAADPSDLFSLTRQS